MLKEHLQTGALLILDGAIGTELERRGAPLEDDASWARTTLTHPDLIREVHEDYLRAGADIITANTYSSGLHVLEKIGLGDELEACNAQAVRLALEALDRTSPTTTTTYVAGSVSAFGNGAMHYCASDGVLHWGEPDQTRLRSNFRRQLEILASSGVDLILLELLCAPIDETVIAIEEAVGCGVPVWLSLSAYVEPETQEVLLAGIATNASGEPDVKGTDKLAQVVDQLKGTDAGALLVMHSEIDVVEPALRVMRAHWPGPIGAYPNRTGYWDGQRWIFVADVTPAAYAQCASQWVESGAQIVGGCCGVGPEHIAALRLAFPRH